MFSRIRTFLDKHKRKFLVGGVLIGGTILLSRYAQKKLREWQEKETQELFERTRRQLYFENIEKTCNQTAVTLGLNLKDTIDKCLKTDELLNELRSGGSTNKVTIWEELKILSFAKLVSLVYASSMLMITLRVQLNLIGGYMFRYTTEDNPELTVNNPLQGVYLSLLQHFLQDGIKRLCSLIEEKVRFVISDRSLKEKLTVHDIEQIFWAVQSSINNDIQDPSKNLRNYVLPNQMSYTLSEPESTTLKKIVSETHDILESEEILSLTSSCISGGFSLFMTQLTDYFTDIGAEKTCDSLVAVAGPSTKENIRFVPDNLNLTKISIPMAKVIPLVNGLLQRPGNSSPCTWMEQLILNDKLKVLGANIYEAFSNKG